MADSIDPFTRGGPRSKSWLDRGTFYGQEGHSERQPGGGGCAKVSARTSCTTNIGLLADKTRLFVAQLWREM